MTKEEWFEYAVDVVQKVGLGPVTAGNLWRHAYEAGAAAERKRIAEELSVDPAVLLEFDDSSDTCTLCNIFEDSGYLRGAAAERDACAKLAEYWYHGDPDAVEECPVPEDIAEAIRARGEGERRECTWRPTGPGGVSCSTCGREWTAALASEAGPCPAIRARGEGEK